MDSIYIKKINENISHGSDTDNINWFVRNKDRFSLSATIEDDSSPSFNGLDTVLESSMEKKEVLFL